MSLSLYKKKRNFSETPEPAGKEKTSKGALRFVIQKHDASHLHYDFRLEMEGVLKSWAVPKGPSLNPADKRLAMMVEDHPYDYRTFEGIIPEGNYGAGTVMVWDEGYYEPLEADGKSKKEQDKMLLNQLHKGSIKIRMHGKKLKGEFALVKIKSDESGKSWLLIKHNDNYAKDIDITTRNKSVVSNKTLATIAKENGSELKHPEEKRATAKANNVAKKVVASKSATKKRATKKQASKKAASKTTARKKKVPQLNKLLGKSFSLVNESPLPAGIKPMLATLTDDAYDDENWLFEIKWDGYRALANVQDGNVRLVSRNNKPFTERYTPVTEALARLPFNAVLDGEIIAVNEKGMAEFQMMQNWQSAPETPLQYYIFDIIWLNGYDVTSLPLIERKDLLEKILPEGDDVIKYSSHIMESGKAFFEAAMEQGLEGIMAKRADSRYTIGNRSADWLKIKVNQRQEVVIAGYTQPRNTRKNFGALILGIYDGNDLVYVGH
ncbi:MAG TPA: non-homologous end-joining DNA ligase, partial [Chitinophagaceae bacterium]